VVDTPDLPNYLLPGTLGSQTNLKIEPGHGSLQEVHTILLYTALTIDHILTLQVWLVSNALLLMRNTNMQILKRKYG
jgi:hypothetical protein